jgi:NADH-quinone oxidoreductase subunit M
MISLLLILIPLLTGLTAFFIRNEKTVRSWVLFSTVITLAVSILGLTVLKEEKYLQYQADWLPALGSSFYVKLDGMGQLLCLLTAVSYPIIFIATWNTSYKKAHNFFALMLLAQVGLMGVFLAMDALLFYFFWELALIPMYFLCSQWGGERRIQVTFKFFIYTFVGSLLMLIGIIYLQSKTADHSFSINLFYELQTQLSGKTQSCLFWLFFIAFAIKMPIFPLHTWQPDTYEQAPTATTMVLSGVMVKMGLLGLIRWLLPVLSVGAYQWSDIIPPMALIGLIYASLIAIRQDNIKRLIAYSSIAHIGLMCAAAFSVNIYGMQGVIIQMFSHGINIIGLWIAVEIIERRYAVVQLSGLGGLAQKAPALTIFFVIIALANIGLPLTNAFVGEFLMFNGIIQINSNFYVWFVVMAGMGIILSAVYTLNMIRKIFYGKAVSVGNAIDISFNEKLALGVIVILIFVLGVYPQPMLDMSHGFSDGIINKVNIIHYTGKQ